MTEPWYSKGLRFSCTQCGDCCTGAPGFVWITDEEIAALADFLGESVEKTRLLYTREAGKERSIREKNNGDCIFFEKGKGCQVYPVRPTQCKTWPFWESNVRSEDDWKETCQICPGSGKGQLISADEITWRLRQRRL